MCPVFTHVASSPALWRLKVSGCHPAVACAPAGLACARQECVFLENTLSHTGPGSTPGSQRGAVFSSFILLCGGNDCRCVCANHLLAREDPCSTQTNMRILLVFIRFYASWNSRNSTCTVFPLTHSCYYVQTSLSTSYFLNEDVLVCAFLLTMSFPSPARLCIERSIRTMKASSCSAMMLLLHQASVCSRGQKQYAVNCATASSGWYAACKRDVIGYRFTGHSAKIACLVASNANSDSFQTGREEPRVTAVCLAEDVFSLLSDLAPLLPRDGSDRVALLRCLII